MPRRSLLLMVIDATVRLDEPSDPGFVELGERLDPRPRGQRDGRLHLRIGGEDDELLVFCTTSRSCRRGRDTRSCTAPALPRPRGCGPAAHAGWAGCARPRVRCTAGAAPRWADPSCTLRGDRSHADVEIALVGHLHPGQVGGRAIGEVPDHRGHDDDDSHGHRHPGAASTSRERSSFEHACHLSLVWRKRVGVEPTSSLSRAGHRI